MLFNLVKVDSFTKNVLFNHLVSKNERVSYNKGFI